MNYDQYQKQVKEAAEYIKRFVKERPKLGIVLGSGLGSVAAALTDPFTLPYKEIPHFPVSTAPGHKGELVFGRIGALQTLLMSGRLHAYEGFSMREIVFPIRVMQLLGTEMLFVTNASGGLNPDFELGVPMLITDHINFMGNNPLVGQNYDTWGPRFPDMSEVYDLELRKKAVEAARELGIKLQEGVYVAVTGPNFETPAELRMLRRLGADAVGMSTVPEVICAVHAGIRVLGVSAITDRAVAEDLEPLTAEQVLEIAEKTGHKIASIFLKITERL
ncbi:MAG TPA: purine-nucleoside phosphorylase [Thermotogota bacterium]|nr:purine-nucleoside phosphorylase [Thermotogota bacterium]NLH19704.1 purine-nucleoside phosphorylase [Thermotogaceae bacterium]HNW46583.1 purine-nucleoside phosphorylase [Thermotogota bacterium]HNY81754.1 purine-nucleoside phosphorylase [Thermotogota bacterium]HOD90853.1 purine-nucleoside phosphorylase [Thermotogota bacterium]